MKFKNIFILKSKKDFLPILFASYLSQSLHFQQRKKIFFAFCGKIHGSWYLPRIQSTHRNFKTNKLASKQKGMQTKHIIQKPQVLLVLHCFFMKKWNLYDCITLVYLTKATIWSSPWLYSRDTSCFRKCILHLRANLLNNGEHRSWCCCTAPGRMFHFNTAFWLPRLAATPIRLCN